MATGDGTTASAPVKTSPVEPSIEITSPSVRVTSPQRTVLAATSTSSASAPQTQVLPIPRATTAACEVLPPRLVRMPVAAIIPLRSSGLVSLRTRTTSSPRAAQATAVGESKTTLPTAAPGEAAIPRVSRSRSAAVSNCGNISWASCAPVTRCSASSMVISCSSTSWQAIRKAAAGVRLPTRVCSIQSFPRSTVNSMSHRSR